MDRRAFLRTSAAAGAAACLAGTGHGAADRRPSFLVVVTDQQHWQAMGVMDPFFRTPNMDALAREGVLFDHAFCTTPQCSPSRASIYTGLYPHATDVIGNIGSVGHTGDPVPALRPGLATIGSVLKGAGYLTGYTGKWHLGNHEHFAGHFDLANLDTDPRDGATADASAWLTERAGEPDRPFALFVNYINPHDIYEFVAHEMGEDDTPPDPDTPLPASWAEDFEGKPPVHKEFLMDDQGEPFVGAGREQWQRYREGYRAKCALVDAQLGRLLRTLRELGLDDDTVVIFTSDHGDMDAQHRLVFKGPFMYEHMVRVPFIARVPARMGGSAGARSSAMVTLCDIMPTLCDFAGADPGPVHGTSLAPFLTGAGPAPRRDFVVSQYYNKQRWVNPIRMFRTRDMKYNRYQGHMDELYDLREDPDEMVNLIGDPARADARERLSEGLRDWMVRHGDTAFEEYWATTRGNARR